MNIKDIANKASRLFMGRYSPDEATEALLGFLRQEKLNDPADLKYALECGANINAQDNTGSTILNYLVLTKKKTLFDELIKHHPDPNIPDHSGHTPLHTAAAHHDPYYIQALVSIGADASIRNAQGDTPLHNMAHHASSTMRDTPVNLLRACHSFDPNLTNKKGETALDIACWESSGRLISQLAEMGAHIPSRIDAHSELRPYIDEARSRWLHFCHNPDVTALTPQDIRFFANIGTIGAAFDPNLWHGHEHHMVTLLDSLDGFLIRQVQQAHPDLAMHLTPANSAIHTSTIRQLGLCTRPPAKGHTP